MNFSQKLFLKGSRDLKSHKMKLKSENNYKINFLNQDSTQFPQKWQPNDLKFFEKIAKFFRPPTDRSRWADFT